MADDSITTDGNRRITLHDNSISNDSGGASRAGLADSHTIHIVGAKCAFCNRIVIDDAVSSTFYHLTILIPSISDRLACDKGGRGCHNGHLITRADSVVIGINRNHRCSLRSEGQGISSRTARDGLCNVANHFLFAGGKEGISHRVGSSTSNNIIVHLPFVGKVGSVVVHEVGGKGHLTILTDGSVIGGHFNNRSCINRNRIFSAHRGTAITARNLNGIDVSSRGFACANCTRAFIN